MSADLVRACAIKNTRLVVIQGTAVWRFLAFDQLICRNQFDLIRSERIAAADDAIAFDSLCRVPYKRNDAVLQCMAWQRFHSQTAVHDICCSALPEPGHADPDPSISPSGHPRRHYNRKMLHYGMGYSPHCNQSDLKISPGHIIHVEIFLNIDAFSCLFHCKFSSITV